ncbi:hypothetical protein L228DRAFT_281871 [Xylona heveae TC161]|uniref:Large ribosomal subunit protein uL23m n=1 Tax=Xylona heveae (strain CBS 132557 / TC161) TaxID=1328760 RepID=A0A165H863_XYLHT|nr:hypothetical protein L228DRAFT_281871 [Xylona heveae TC161]KZF23119.1 hypothetical protein L228DRAFT_281871 [Xylona heveae TC161]
MATNVPALAARHFNLGGKEVYLPNFTLTLLRTPFLPPNYASFIVPLNLNKLDIRDYLFHAYGVKVVSVRSYVQQQRVRQDKPGSRMPAPRRWYRPRSIKKMTVEMDKPFVWPEEPEDFSSWEKERYDAAAKSQEKEQEKYRPDYAAKPTAERKSIAEQAQALLSGKEQWRPQWVDSGAPVEVEQDLPMSRDSRP